MLLNKLDGEELIRLKNAKHPKDIIDMDFKFHKKNKEAKLTIV